MGIVGYVVLVGSLVLCAQALFSLYLMLYTWEHPERLLPRSKVRKFIDFWNKSGKWSRR